MTPSQCRAARALLDMTQPQLAEAAGLGLSTIVDFEKSRRELSPEAMGRIGAAFDASGVLLLDSGATREGGPGVRLREGLSSETIALEDLNASNDE